MGKIIRADSAVAVVKSSLSAGTLVMEKAVSEKRGSIFSLKGFI